MNRLRDSRAFTLVEMLVVIAIISILTAIAVPTMGKLGMFGRDPLNVAARQTLVMLKAARIYAGAHNIDTAVVYSIGPRIGQQTATTDAEPIQVIESIAMVRRLTPLELDQLEARVNNMAAAGEIDSAEAADRIDWARQGCESSGTRYLPFVPVKGAEGLFKPLQKGAVIAPRDDATGEIDFDYNTWGPDGWALSPVRVVDDRLAPILPRAIKGSGSPPDRFEYMAAGYGDLPGRFPAHVFKPSGVLQTPGAAKARFVISVIPDPEASTRERFLENGEPVPAENIEIYSTIGRIQAAS